MDSQVATVHWTNQKCHLNCVPKSFHILITTRAVGMDQKIKMMKDLIFQIPTALGLMNKNRLFFWSTALNACYNKD